jgi:hypothetical protein
VDIVAKSLHQRDRRALTRITAPTDPISAVWRLVERRRLSRSPPIAPGALTASTASP